MKQKIENKQAKKQKPFYNSRIIGKILQFCGKMISKQFEIINSLVLTGYAAVMMLEQFKEQFVIQRVDNVVAS